MVALAVLLLFLSGAAGLCAALRFSGWLARGLVGGLTALAVLVLAPLIVFLGYVLYQRLWVDPSYAGRVFDGVAYERVLASKRFQFDAMGCTYAVVTLAPTAPMRAPRFDRGYWDSFGGDWQSGPPPFLIRDAAGRLPDSDPFQYCLPEHLSRFEAASADPQVQWIAGETSYLYSRAAGIAARVRLGD